MILYLLLLVLSIAISLFDFTNINKVYKRVMLILFLGICIILSGIRWNLGTDWSLYHDFYVYNTTLSDFLGDVEDPSRLEPGYGLLNYIHMNIFNDYNMFMLLMALFTISVKVRWILKYTKYPLIAGMVYFTTYLGDIFYIRQYIAVAITVFSFDYIVKRESIKFICTVLLASTIHTSAIVFLLAYPLYNEIGWVKKLTLKKIIVALTVVIVMDLSNASNYLLESFMDAFPPDIGKIVQKVHAYYLLQQQGENFGANIDNAVRLGSAIFRRLLFVPVYLYVYKRLKEIDSTFGKKLKIVLIGYVVFFMFTSISYDFAGRLSLYFTFFEILLIADIFKIKMSIFQRSIFVLAIILYCVVKYVFILNTFPEAYIPFQTFLN